MNELIKDIIYSSIKNLFHNQPDIFENTDYTHFTEWNLSYHLSNEISKYIFWLNVDVDVIKSNYDNKRPDIIFHKRKSNALNLLVVELKKKFNDDQSDIEKIKMNWMRKPLNYRYGAYINIWALGHYKAILFEKEGKEFEVNDMCNYIEIPNLNNKEIIEFKKYTNEIIFNNKNMSIKMINELMDSLIIKYYRKDLVLKEY